MIEKYDLHCHSTASDGSLTPTEVLLRAKEHGVTSLALTDHDTINGQQEAIDFAPSIDLKFITGIEISVTWERKCFHIIGLNIDIHHAKLTKGIEKLQQLRKERAAAISAKLEKKKIFHAHEEILKVAGQAMITRSHFADFLLENNHVKTKQEAFDRYLGRGKPAFVSTTWAELQDAVDWINQAGGIAILAHPLRYKLTTRWITRFLEAFKEMGGQGIEVVTGRSSPDEIFRGMSLAKQYSLAASVGSDFHSPQNRWIELGKLHPLPQGVPPVWALFNTL
ncbi:MAG: PHP domain-containing protein [Methylococcales bacterium]|nr:PHP domain-containing protein [Methylococcales bacterium]